MIKKVDDPNRLLGKRGDNLCTIFPYLNLSTCYSLAITTDIEDKNLYNNQTARIFLSENEQLLI